MKENLRLFVGLIVALVLITFLRGMWSGPVALADRHDPELPTLLQLGAKSCPPCRKMMPILKELQDSHGGEFNVQYVDVHKSPEIARQYNVIAIPVQVFMNAEGELLGRNDGYLTKDQILKAWESLGVGAGAAAD